MLCFNIKCNKAPVLVSVHRHNIVSLVIFVSADERVYCCWRQRRNGDKVLCPGYCTYYHSTYTSLSLRDSWHFEMFANEIVLHIIGGSCRSWRIDKIYRVIIFTSFSFSSIHVINIIFILWLLVILQMLYMFANNSITYFYGL